MKNQPTQAPKQLKKTDFLSAITTEPMTRAELESALEGFDYVSSYADYLIDHFEKQNKIERDENEDGEEVIFRKGKKGASAKVVFKADIEVTDAEVEGEEPTAQWVLLEKENKGVLSEEDKAAGWSMTRSAAVKKATSQIFAEYKEQTALVKALLEDSKVDDAE